MTLPWLKNFPCLPDPKLFCSCLKERGEKKKKKKKIFLEKANLFPRAHYLILKVYSLITHIISCPFFSPLSSIFTFHASLLSTYKHFEADQVYSPNKKQFP